jgi:hypothetical protein
MDGNSIRSILTGFNAEALVIAVPAYVLTPNEFLQFCKILVSQGTGELMPLLIFYNQGIFCKIGMRSHQVQILIFLPIQMGTLYWERKAKLSVRDVFVENFRFGEKGASDIYDK